MREANPTKARDPRPGLWASEGIEIPNDRPGVRGGLLLYHFPTAFWFRDASTILDHVEAFQHYSRFGIQKLNTDVPLPGRVAAIDFELVIVHYSVISAGFYPLTEDHLRWLKTSKAHKVLFVQDEFMYCKQRFWFCDEIGVDALYTLLEPSEFQEVYGSHTQVPSIRTNLPGYVSEQMVADVRRLGTPDEERPIDIGYRGRPLPAYCGRGGMEKYEIGQRFTQLGAGSGLVLDIGLREEDRIYGKHWPGFLSRCKGVLGVESGVSVFDLEDRVVDQYERLTEESTEVTLDDLTEAAPLEGQIYYRTISPRHFEAAAMRCCQVLFEGRYSGAIEPMVHFIPLRKDFSNLDDVLELFRNAGTRRELTENAYRDLIASGRFSYRRFIERFDQNLIEAGLDPEVPDSAAVLAARAVNHGRRWRTFKAHARSISKTRVIGSVLVSLFKITGFLRRRLRRVVNPGYHG